MTAYRDFVSDFPSRCLDVLRMAETKARLQQRQVTLALMVASAGFVVPYERLSIKKAHPTGDAKKFAEASSKLAALMQMKFLVSPLGRGADSWHGGKLNSIKGYPDEWPEFLKAKPLSPDKTVGGLLRILRNALAHGNIFTHGDPIKALVFVGSNTDDEDNIIDFSFARVSPEDFVRFLKQWFEFLRAAQIMVADAA